MITRIFSWRRVKYSRIYDTYMNKGRPDIALAVALKRKLGQEPAKRAAERWYDILITKNDFPAAESVATRFKLPEEYLKHAQAENLRLMATQMEDGSYTLLESARELRNQAERVEASIKICSQDGKPARFVMDQQNVSEQKGMDAEQEAESAERINSSIKLYESGSRLLSDIGLLIYESELRLGNETYAELVANGYGIKEEDRQKIVEMVSNGKAANKR